MSSSVLNQQTNVNYLHPANDVETATFDPKKQGAQDFKDAHNRNDSISPKIPKDDKNYSNQKPFIVTSRSNINSNNSPTHTSRNNLPSQQFGNHTHSSSNFKKQNDELRSQNTDLSNQLRQLKASSAKEIAILKQNLELTEMKLNETIEQADNQKQIYDRMVATLNNSSSPSPYSNKRRLDNDLDCQSNSAVIEAQSQLHDQLKDRIQELNGKLEKKDQEKLQLEKVMDEQKTQHYEQVLNLRNEKADLEAQVIKFKQMVKSIQEEVIERKQGQNEKETELNQIKAQMEDERRDTAEQTESDIGILKKAFLEQVEKTQALYQQPKNFSTYSPKIENSSVAGGKPPTNPSDQQASKDSLIQQQETQLIENIQKMNQMETHFNNLSLEKEALTLQVQNLQQKLESSLSQECASQQEATLSKQHTEQLSQQINDYQVELNQTRDLLDNQQSQTEKLQNKVMQQNQTMQAQFLQIQQLQQTTLLQQQNQQLQAQVDASQIQTMQTSQMSQMRSNINTQSGLNIMSCYQPDESSCTRSSSKHQQQQSQQVRMRQGQNNNGGYAQNQQQPQVLGIQQMHNGMQHQLLVSPTTTNTLENQHPLQLDEPLELTELLQGQSQHSQMVTGEVGVGANQMEQTTEIMENFGAQDDLYYLQSKLNQAAELVKESCTERDQLAVDYQNMLLENDRLKLIVEQKKTAIALLEEKKAENELRMKREIKFLLQQMVLGRENMSVGQTLESGEENGSCSDDNVSNNASTNLACPDQMHHNPMMHHSQVMYQHQ